MVLLIKKNTLPAEEVNEKLMHPFSFDSSNRSYYKI
jgi:hypothetical protein